MNVAASIAAGSSCELSDATQASSSVSTTGSVTPMATSAPASSGATSAANQPGPYAQSASATAIASCEAFEIATFRPRAMFAPGASITVMPSAAWSSASVASVDPPSTTTTSSAARDWPAIESRNAPTCSCAFSTVAISEIFIGRPLGRRRG
jgi:hypothetical protein